MKNQLNFWSNALPDGYYDKVLKTDTKKKSGMQGMWHHLSYKIVSKSIDKNDNHLDYACGPGSLIGLYLECVSTGYDFANNQIEYAKKNYPENKNFFTSDIAEVDKNAPYSKITIMGLLEYLTDEEIENLFEFLKSRLRENGKIIITSPNYRSSLKFIEIVANKIGVVDYSPVNINKLNKLKLHNLASKHFENIKITKIINFGIFFSIINHDLGTKVEKLFSELFNNFFGFLLLAELSIKTSS